MGYKLMDEWFRRRKRLSVIQIDGLIFEEERDGNNLRKAGM